MMRRLGAIIVGAVWLGAACSSATSPTDALQQGVWGGTGIKMTVLATGANIEFDCDSGAITTPLVFTHDRSFTVNGTYAFGRGGPRQPGDPPPTQHTARYQGEVDGKTLRLTIEVVDLSRSIGTYALELGRQPLLDRCL